MAEIDVARRRLARRLTHLRRRGVAALLLVGGAVLVAVATVVVVGTLVLDIPGPQTLVAGGRPPDAAIDRVVRPDRPSQTIPDAGAPNESATDPAGTDSAGTDSGVGDEDRAGQDDDGSRPLLDDVPAPPDPPSPDPEPNPDPDPDPTPEPSPEPEPEPQPDPSGPIARLVDPVLDGASTLLPVLTLVRPPVDLLLGCVDGILLPRPPPACRTPDRR